MATGFSFEEAQGVEGSGAGFSFEEAQKKKEPSFSFDDAQRFERMKVVTADDRMELARRNFYEEQDLIEEGLRTGLIRSPERPEPEPGLPGYAKFEPENPPYMAREKGQAGYKETVEPEISDAPGAVVTMDTPMLDLGGLLLKDPKTVTNPVERGIIESLGPTLNGLTSRRNVGYLLGSMGVASSGQMAAKLVSALWTAVMGKELVESAPAQFEELAYELYKPEGERDKGKIAKILTDTGTTAAFAAAPAVHLARGTEGPAAMVAREFERGIPETELGSVEPWALAGGRPVGVRGEMPKPTVTAAEFLARDVQTSEPVEWPKGEDLPPPSGQVEVGKTRPGATGEDVLEAEGPKTAKESEFTATTPVAGEPIRGRFEVVEADDLVTSFDPGYDAALQPRDRTRAASASQVADIVRKFEPQRLGDSPTTDLGAPMVDERNHVLRGNGRTTALRTLYGSEVGGGVYKDWLAQNAKDFGLDPQSVLEMERPVLVRRVTDYGKLDKVEFARQSNQQQVLGMGEAEKAAADAKMLLRNPKLVETFRPGEEGNVLAVGNRDFLNAFIQGTGDAAELLTKDGYNGPALSKRVKNAVLGAFIGPENHTLLNRLIEGAEELNIKSAVNGTMTLAPALMRFKGTPYDLSASMHQALKDLVTIRTTGEKLYDFLTSRPLFGDPTRTAQSDMLLRYLAEAKSTKAIAEALGNYARQAGEAMTDAQSGGMFGLTPATREQILKRVYGTGEEARAKDQGDLAFGKSSGGGRSGSEASGSEAANAGEGPKLSVEQPPSVSRPAAGNQRVVKALVEGGERKIYAMAAGGGPAPAPTPTPVPAPGPGAPAIPKATPSIWNHFTRARQAFQSVFSPQNLDATAKTFANILRHYNAQGALDLVRADRHLGELRSHFDRTPVPKDWVYDPAQPLPHNFAVIDALERDRTRLPAELQAWSKAMDEEFAWRIAEVRKMKPGAMRSLIANYFPHMWEDPKSGMVQSLMAEVAARAPMHGSKAFMKERTLPLTVDGLARGLRPISDNPVDLVLAKLHQMDKFIMATRTIEEAKTKGMLKYYPLGREIPAGRTVVDDPAFTVYAPPFLPVKEAFDAGIRRGLMDFIHKMKWRHERVDKLGVDVWGQYASGGEIKSRFGGPDFVIMHEIGHGLDERYGLSGILRATPTLRTEIAALADLRGKGISASHKFKKYIQTPEEQVANAVHAYIYAPDLMAKTAPSVGKVLADFINKHPELQDLNDIKPGLRLQSGTMEMRLPGPVLAGRWTLPDGAAAVLSNFLSPGLGRFWVHRTLRSASNILNGAQLGLSGFHVGFTSLDAVVSSVATGLGYVLGGHPVRAAKSFAFAPVAPVANYYVGKAVQMKMVDPEATHVPVMDFPAIGIRGYEHKLSPKTDALTRAIAELAVQGGLRAETDPFWKTNVTRNLVRAFHEGGVKGYANAGWRIPFALVEQSMRPIAEYLVPRQKLGVFAQLALQEMQKVGWGARVDEVRAAMARAADATEDRMGQMTYDNLFYNKAVKDVALLGFRAYGWQLGKYRHLYGAAADAGKMVTGRGGITNRMLYPLALTMVAATVGAIVHRLLTGRNPEQLQDYLFPENGQVDRQGRPQRLALPTYMKDLVSDWHDFPSLKKMGASFYHKLNPWISQVVDMLRNKDYYGVEVRREDDPLLVQMKDLGLFSVKQFTPFSISGTMKLAEAESPASQMVLPFFGIVPAKRALTMTPAETLAADIIQQQLPVGARTRESADHSALLRQLAQDLRKVPGAKLDAQDPRLAQLKPGEEKQLVSMLTMKPLQYQIHKMTPADAMRVWRLANADERQLLQVQIVTKVANSKTLDPKLLSAYLAELQRLKPR